MQRQAGYFATAFKAQEQVLLLALKSKKPSETSPVFQEVFQDLIQGQAEVNGVREKNRKSPQDNHLAMLSDGVSILFWVVQPSKPDDFVGEVLGGARMWGNRILTQFKEKCVSAHAASGLPLTDSTETHNRPNM